MKGKTQLSSELLQESATIIKQLVHQVPFKLPKDYIQ
jgi:hypothetical protein